MKTPNNLPARKPIALLIATLCIVCLFSGTVLAAGAGTGGGDGAGGSGGTGSGSGGSGNGGSGTQPGRKVDLDVGQYTARITSTRRVGANDDSLGYQLEAQNRLRIQMEYRNQASSAQADLRACVTYVEVLEFEDADVNGVYDRTDPVVSRYMLEGAAYKQLQHQERRTLDGRTEQVITAETQDGRFRLVLHSAGEAARISSGPLSPSWLKVDIEMDGAQYLGTNTRLALHLRVETQARATIMQQATRYDGLLEPGEGGIELAQEGSTGFYSWANNATVDGVQTQVRTTTTTTANAVDVYSAYARGSSISHDPKLGIPVATVTTEEAFDLMARLLPYVMTLAIAAAVVGVAVRMRRKQNGTAAQ